MEINFPKLEEKVLRFWKKNQIFEKSIEKGKKDFVFYEGPPYANGRPGIHHFLARAFKDIVCRYKTMRGFRVLRKAGWDTHGLPTEMEVEKILGIKNKKEIEKLGIEKFIKECKKNVFLYKKEWEKFTERIGYWIDLKNAYITCSNEYIESVWFLLKKIWEKGLLYEDLKVSPYCPRCQTILSSHEVAQGYKRIKEPAIYVKFRVLNPEYKNCSLLVWTTTPWTLPGNVAIAVNPNFDYIFLEKEGEVLILAKERVKTLNIEGKFLKEVKGKDLIGLRYQPVFDFYQPDFEKERIWEVLGADFVSLEEGTGLVHIAPAFGEEDMELIKTQNSKLKTQSEKRFPVILNVDEEGKFKLEVKKFAGLFVKNADPLIIQDLKERGILFKEEIYEHDYPFCWRCKSPLLYYAKKSWFIKMTAVKKDLIKNNQKINWTPAHLKEGRFGEWLREIKDWALSRERYWGTPLPIWRCQNCGHLEVIGSRDDLMKQKFSKNRYLILRHGESEMNVKNILISTLPEKIPCPLTEKGREQILKVAKKLKKEKIDLIISSDLLRTKQTAEILAKELAIKVIFDKRLRDIRAGVFEGKNIKEHNLFWKNYEERFLKALKGGENYNQVKMRIYNFFKSLERKYSGKTILVISHQRPFAMLEGAIKGYSIKEFSEKIEPRKMKTGELREIEFKLLPYDKKGNLDFHKPYIDEIKFFCPKCQGEMKRVPEVIDCWFDSGAMPFAQYHWPFAQNQKSKIKNQKLKPPKFFPADYIAEGIDQTRGWFYTLLAISTLMGFGPAYKNVISLGHVLDERGEKMSKSRGNVVDPWAIVRKYGADTTRWYFFTINQPWDSKLFSEKDIVEFLRKFILTFWNCYLFFETYGKKKEMASSKSKNVLDKWIVSRLENLIKRTSEDLEKYDITRAAREIEKFVIEDLSLWYIRRSRRRFQRPESEEELKEASQTLKFVLVNLSKILAPFLPFLSEFVYQKLQTFYFKHRTSNIKHLISVHLEDWPKVDEKLIDKKLERKMEKVREIVSLALAERQKTKIKVRQPLNELQITDFQLQKETELLELIKEEVNVKKISFGKEFKLDTEITPELKEEGILREVIRQIQEMRKELRLKPRDRVLVGYSGSESILKILKKNREKILNEAKILDLKEKEREFDLEKEIKVENEKIILTIKKISARNSSPKRTKT
jgi:isoleucyl-tRNA synthetase